MGKIEVDKIVLKVGKKKEIELSLEEAKELQQVLSDLLGIKDNRVTVISPPVTIPYPVPVPRRYDKWVVNPWVPYDGTITICDTNVSSGSISSVKDISSGTYVT